MSDIVNTSVLAKIQKLMALAESGNNLNESSNAYAQAQALLLKHKLTMAEVEIASKAFGSGETIGQGSKPIFEGQRVIHWKSYLAAAIAKLNGCKMFIQNGFTKRYMLVGRASDMEIVDYLFQSVATQIESICKETMKAGMGEGKTFSNNFKYGATETVISRLKEAQEVVREEYKGTAALVLVDSKAAEVEKWVETNMKLKKAIPTVSRGDSSAFGLGRAAGHRVSLNKGVGASSGMKGYLK